MRTIIMDKYSYSTFFSLIVLLVGSCSQLSSPAEQTPLSTLPSSQEMGCSFVDSGQNLGAGRSWDVSLGDLDGDGDLDAFVANGSHGDVSSQVWLNDGSGIFSPINPQLGFGTGLELGDLDGDSDLDIFIVGWEEQGRVWLNDGEAGFTDSGQLLGESGGFDVGLGDLDQDGDLDAVIAHELENTIWINNGEGFFADSGQRLGTAISAAAGIADLDGDGDLDLITAGWDEPGLVWLNDGEGTFTNSGQTLSPGLIHIHGLAVADLNSNGIVDVVLAGSPNQTWMNDGAGVFSEVEQNLRLAPGDTAAIGDLDGDGDLDVYLAVGTVGQSDDSIWINDGTGIFSDCVGDFSTGFSSGIGLGDLDGDGDLDAFIVHGQLSLSEGGGRPNEVWWNETY
ncbi:MAG: hypothetical protein DRI65_06315 [Chloroflexota bacterium]|nr:MAG: hypothetical protein DRI65_06315 [Chloroflexota bacterium]